MMKKQHYKLITGGFFALTTLSACAGVSLTSLSHSSYSIVESGGVYSVQAPNGVSGTLVSTAPNSYQFGLIPTPTGPLGALNTPGEFNIDGRAGSIGNYTATFTLDPGEALSHIAYVGGDLLGYSYNATAGTVSLTVSPTAVAKSASNSVGGTMLGLSISTYDPAGPAVSMGASVFNTNAWWGDLSGLKDAAGYGSAAEALGLNFDGANGESVNFNYYVAMDVLRDSPRTQMTALDELGFEFRKAGGVAIAPTIDLTYYTNGVDPIDPKYTDPAFMNRGTNGGASSFNFGAEGGEDNYVKVSLNNDSWSDANAVLFNTVPEPSSALIGGLGSVLLLLRRRRC